MQPWPGKRIVNVARAGDKAGSGADTSKNFPGEKLPVGRGERDTEVSERYPGERECENSMWTEPVNQMTTGNLHSGVSREYARSQKSG